MREETKQVIGSQVKMSIGASARHEALLAGQLDRSRGGHPDLGEDLGELVGTSLMDSRLSLLLE